MAETVTLLAACLIMGVLVDAIVIYACRMLWKHVQNYREATDSSERNQESDWIFKWAITIFFGGAEGLVFTIGFFMLSIRFLSQL